MTRFLSQTEIAELVFSELDEDSIRELQENCRMPDDVIRYHHSTGQYIRNRFSLWDEENPYTKSNAQPNENGIFDDPLFPDQVSHDILVKIWHLANKV